MQGEVDNLQRVNLLKNHQPEPFGKLMYGLTFSGQVDLFLLVSFTSEKFFFRKSQDYNFFFIISLMIADIQTSISLYISSTSKLKS